MKPTKETLDEVKSLLFKAQRPLFLGGAGVSTASGIPDFRSKSGLYSIRSEYGVGYETMLSEGYFFAHTEEFYDFYWKRMVAFSAKPNPAHLALSSFGWKRRLPIITQNIDGLHQKAGSKIVYEMHGSTLSYHCLSCGRHFGLDEIPHAGVPHCPCGGLIKPDVVLYGEPLDGQTIEDAAMEMRFCDFLLIAGTSMAVYPVAGLPECMISGVKVIVNAEPTAFDGQCDYVIHGDLTRILPYILGEGEWNDD